MTTPATLPAPPTPTHPCLRCGRPVPIQDSLCETCNPLGLKQPAATQVHAIAAGGILFFVLIMALVGRAWLGGVGPFRGAIGGVAAAADGGLVVQLTVTNDGSTGAATSCRVVEAERPVGGPGQLVQTPIVPAGQALTFSATVTVFGDQVRDLAIDCRSP